MTLLEMIAEWRKGCSCAGPAHDAMFHPKNPTSATECEPCTVGLIDAMEQRIKRMGIDEFEQEREAQRAQQIERKV